MSIEDLKKSLFSDTPDQANLDPEVSLQDSLGYIQSILDTSRTSVLVLNADLRINTANRAFYQTFSIPSGTAEGVFLYDLQNSAWNIPALLEQLSTVLPLQSSFEDFEVSHDFLSLGRRTMLLNGRKLWSEGNNATKIVLVIEDITIRKKIEETLLRSNEDFQRFAYVAAHDLRTPLGVALGLSQILSSRIRDRLDEKENRMLTMAIDSMQSLGSLMEDILSYSSASAEASVNKIVVAEESLNIALANLQKEIKDTGAIIHHESLPTLLADRTQLALLFQNLIGNAIKYRRADVIPEIHIGAKREDANWDIFISDNGVGFEQEEAEKIFEPFTRLDSKDNKGNGIGLATCKRIVERMNGKISATSTKGHGAVFLITLPLFAPLPKINRR